MWLNGVIYEVVDSPKEPFQLTKGLKVLRFPKQPNRVIKSGINKGTRPTVWKTKPKFKTLMDVPKIVEMFNEWSQLGDITYVGESQVFINKAASARTSYYNHGRVEGIAYTYGDVHQINPSVWKGKLGLTTDKESSIKLVNQLYPSVLIKRHDQAEAVLIGHYYHLYMEKI